MKNFLSGKQAKELEAKGWKADKEGFFVTIGHDEVSPEIWNALCVISRGDVKADSITLMCVGVISNKW